MLRRALEDSNAFSDVTEAIIATTVTFEATDVATGFPQEIEAKHHSAVYAALKRFGLGQHVTHVAVSG